MAVRFAAGFVEDALVEGAILEVLLVLSYPLERVNFIIRLCVRFHHFMTAMSAKSLIRSLIVAEITYADVDADSFRSLPTEEGPLARRDRLHSLLAVVILPLDFDSRHLLLFLLTDTVSRRFHLALVNVSVLRPALEVVA